MKIEIHVKGVSYWWRIVARNGNILSTSETYDSRRNAIRGAKAFKKNLGKIYRTDDSIGIEIFDEKGRLVE